MIYYKSRKGVYLTRICGEYLLVADKEAREFCPYTKQVNETGAYLWKYLALGTTLEGLKECLQKEYEIPDEEAAEQSLRLFLSDMYEHGYLNNEEIKQYS